MTDCVQDDFFTGTNKLILARLGVSRTIYANVDSPNPGFPYFNSRAPKKYRKVNLG